MDVISPSSTGCSSIRRIDESNSETDQYILYPENPFVSAENLWQGLRKHWGVEKFGVILTDSHTTPLRRE